MRSFFAAGLIAFTNAAVHEFFAESNFICGVCQEAVNLARTENFDELEKLYDLLPALAEKVESFKGDASMINLSQPEQTC